MSNEKFKVKIIKIYEPSYNSHLNPFSPTREVEVKVNGIKFEFKTSINFEMANDIKSLGINPDNYIKEIIKEEAIDQFIRSTNILDCVN